MRLFMSRKKKERIPLRTYVCTIVSAAIVLAVFAFSVYAQMPGCAIQNIDDPMWGLLVIAVLLCAAGLLMWGWKIKK